MSELISLIIAAALVNNLVFVQLLGVSYFFGGSGRLNTAIELALFTGAVFLITTAVAQPLLRFVLQPLGLEVFKLVLFLVISGTTSTILALVVKEHFPLTYRSNHLLFHFAGGNSAIMGLLLNNSLHDLSFLQTLAYSLGAAIGFGLVVIGFSAMSLRLSSADVPFPFRQAPIMLLSAGIAAMGFLGFAGLV
ncbi:MAG: electron transport complex protein RnfA [Pseudohongiellaceae bacterium]|jgi:electron transport complex protein RnfA